ncbi:hypothetical protein Bbelb_238430 [Branchiostoma belcheri]|nr:hypothetical protein Bbelb_238430 [Branchiostoma belcheri]
MWWTVAFLSLSVWLLSGMTVGNADNPHGCQVWSPTEVKCAHTDLNEVPLDLPATILRLDLQGSRLKELRRHSFDALKRLQYLDLSWTRFEYVENGTFASLTNLRTLNLSRNGLGDAQWFNITSSLPSLQTLILSDNRLQQLNRRTFRGLHNLTFLDISSNAIIVGECAFCGQQRLQRLDMTDNEISTLPNRLFHPQSELELLDLSNNRLRDDVLAKEEPWSGLARLRTLDCAGPPEYADTRLVNFYINCTSPAPDTEFQPNLPLACAFSSSAVLLYMLTAFLVSYHRWKIKYLMFLLRRRNEDEEPLRGRRFVYDAFVAHNSEDTRWVVRELCHNLENVEDQPRYKLCIHQRNFLPGAPIVNNIVKAIETSRKTICVLTRSFLRSGWCEFELQLAQTPDNLFGKGGSCRLILVFLEEIPRPLLKKYRHLEAVMDRDTYLEWPGDVRGRPLFWRRLRAALGKPVNAERAGDRGIGDDDGHELVPLYGNLCDNVRLFADDCLLYRVIKSPSDAQGLQADLDALTEWQDLHISNDMRWDAHIAHATGKANRTLGVIRRNLSHCTSQVKNTCYKALVRPQLEYCASVWDPYTAGGVQAVERVQRRAARMVMNDYGRTSSVTEMLQKLQWPTLANRRREAQWNSLPAQAIQAQSVEAFRASLPCRLILVFLEEIPRPLLKKYRHLEAVMDRDTYLEWPGDVRGRPLFWRRLRAALGKPVNAERAGDRGIGDDDGHELVPLYGNLCDNVRLFADDCLLYRVIKSPSDAQGLQADLDALTEWQDLHISNDMRWDAHIAHATGKANRTLGVIRRNLSHCTSQVKNTCYKALVRPQLEYCASVWDPYTAGGVQAVERVQRRAARMVMNDYGRTSSVTEMLQKLQWPTLANRRREAQWNSLPAQAIQAQSVEAFRASLPCRLILVFLEEIPRPLLKKYRHLEAVMDRDTYLEWPGDVRGRPLFWRRLRAALGKPVNAERAGDRGIGDDDGHELVPLYGNLCDNVRLFADDCLLYRVIKSPSDAQGLQADLDALTEWQDLHISNDMRWDAHIAHATGKANRTLGVIRRNLSHCTSQVKNTCYKALVRPQLEYCASVWDPYTAGGVQAVERVQRRAARMVMNDYGRTSSVTEMLQKLQWPTLANRRREAQWNSLPAQAIQAQSVEAFRASLP